MQNKIRNHEQKNSEFPRESPSPITYKVNILSISGLNIVLSEFDRNYTRKIRRILCVSFDA